MADIDNNNNNSNYSDDEDDNDDDELPNVSQWMASETMSKGWCLSIFCRNAKTRRKK